MLGLEFAGIFFRRLVRLLASEQEGKAGWARRGGVERAGGAFVKWNWESGVGTSEKYQCLQGKGGKKWGKSARRFYNQRRKCLRPD